MLAQHAKMFRVDRVLISNVSIRSSTACHPSPNQVGMSVARPSACLFCTFKQAAKRSEPTSRRYLHVSPVRSRQEHKPTDGNQPAVTATPSDHPVKNVKQLPQEHIKQNFTPEQAEAIKQTQKHLKFDKKFEEATARNTRPWTMPYFQDLSEVDPLADKPVKSPWSSLDENARLKTDDELNEDIARFMQNIPADDEKAAEAFQTFLDTNRILVGKESAEYSPRSATAPSFPTMKRDEVRAGLMEAYYGIKSEKSETTTVASSDKNGKTGTKDKRGATEGSFGQEISPALVRLMQMTGYNELEISKLRVKAIISHRVVNQTRLGKIQKMYWLSIAGNGHGLLGIGEGKSEESAEGLIQSQYRAIRNMQPIKRYEKRTIFGDVSGKSGATELELYARPPGSLINAQM